MNVRKSLLILLLTSTSISLQGMEELNKGFDESIDGLSVEELVEYVSSQAPLLDISSYNLEAVRKELVRCNRYHKLPDLLVRFFKNIHLNLNSDVKAISAQEVGALCGYLQNVELVRQAMPQTLKMLNSLYEEGQIVPLETIVDLYEENQEQVESLYGMNRTIFEDVGSALLPTYSFKGDTTTGMYHSATSVVGIGGKAAAILLLDGTATTPVNSVTISNADTTDAPTIAASGDDTNVGINFSGKGTGNLIMQSVVASPVGTGGSGAGDTLTIRPGVGEADTAGTGGDGGDLSINGGIGGADTTGTGGDGGVVSISGGTGGEVTGAGTGGGGSSVNISGGTGGDAAGGGTNGGGGSISINPGAAGSGAGGAGAVGTISIGTTTASTIFIGNGCVIASEDGAGSGDAGSTLFLDGGSGGGGTANGGLIHLRSGSPTGAGIGGGITLDSGTGAITANSTNAASTAITLNASGVADSGVTLQGGTTGGVNVGLTADNAPVVVQSGTAAITATSTNAASTAITLNASGVAGSGVTLQGGTTGGVNVGLTADNAPVVVQSGTADISLGSSGDTGKTLFKTAFVAESQSISTSDGTDLTTATDPNVPTTFLSATSTGTIISSIASVATAGQIKYIVCLANNNPVTVRVTGDFRDGSGTAKSQINFAESGSSITLINDGSRWLVLSTSDGATLAA